MKQSIPVLLLLVFFSFCEGYGQDNNGIAQVVYLIGNTATTKLSDKQLFTLKEQLKGEQYPFSLIHLGDLLYGMGNEDREAELDLLFSLMEGQKRGRLLFTPGDMDWNNSMRDGLKMVRRLEELGQITPEEAETHPQRHVLYRALGLGEPVDPDVFTSPIPQPGYILICSDGLWGVVPETDIFRIISTSPNLHKACIGLIEAANAAGGPDNITAVLIRMPD